MPNITGQISRAQELTGNTSGNNRMSGQIQGVRGEKGDKGDKGDTGATGVGIASTTLNSDYTLTIVLTDGTSYTTPSIRGAQGQQGIQGDQGIQGVQGETGNGISSIAKTGTSGLVDTYTVTFTDGTTTTFTVTNGRNGTGSVADVWQNGVSVLDGNTAKVTVPTATSDLTNDSNFVEDANYVHTDNNYTSAEKSKLSGIASGAEVNVQSNWNETDSTADAYIANKPDIDSLKVLVVTLSAFSSLPATFYETAVTADHVCIKAELGTPSAQTGDWTVTTSAGELTISGSISGSTTATLYLAVKA